MDFRAWRIPRQQNELLFQYQAAEQAEELSPAFPKKRRLGDCLKILAGVKRLLEIVKPEHRSFEPTKFAFYLTHRALGCIAHNVVYKCGTVVFQNAINLIEAGLGLLPVVHRNGADNDIEGPVRKGNVACAALF